MKNEYGTCPICNGTARKPATANARAYGWYGYDKDTDTQECHNCGTHGNFGKPDGKVELRPDGTPCEHRFLEETVSNCYHKYVCEHCGSTHHVDSGD